MGSEHIVNEYISELEIDFLPPGMLVKSDTGMGATHFELVSPRHSIVVEPIRVTACNKVLSAKSNCNHPKDRIPFYVGSALGAMAKPSDADITAYLDDASVTYKKFICVADSLPTVMKVISDHEVMQVSLFFLLIDEVDSIQMDSSFRKKMEVCLDYYQVQPKEKRAMLTATPLEFSNPLLASEPVTKFNLSSIISKPTAIVKTPNGLQCIVDRVAELTESETSKIVIVLNHMNSIRQLIDSLVKIGIASNEIAVLCSDLSKDEFSTHFRELTTDLFPCRVNFITSAYYSGYDINESFHLICYANYQVRSTMLSPSQIKQIYGRCRKPHAILSHYIVYRPQFENEQTSFLPLSIEGLKAEAQALVDSERCFNIHYPEGAVDNLGILKNFRSILVDALNSKNMNSVRLNSDGSKLLISYFFIDSRMEQYNTYKTFYSPTASPKDRLTDAGFDVTAVSYFSDTILKAEENQKVSIKKSRLVDKLKTLVELPEEDIGDELRAMEAVFSSTVNGRVLSFINELKYYFPLKDVVTEALNTLVGSDGLPRRDLRAFNYWLVGKYFQTADDNTPIRIFVNHYFKQGDMLSIAQVAENMKDCIVHSQLKTLLGFDSKMPISVEGNAKLLVTLAARFVDFKRKRRPSGDLFFVVGVIPVQTPRITDEIGLSADELFRDHVDISTAYK
ncbi:MAG: hypothetical protein VKN72_02555 [Nostocales cyanobacterium 94392]|nr:hypothetical protein [Nostocales cyanobacterium 94392]